MSSLADNAVELFFKGLNCSQVVLGSFCEKYGMKQEQGFAIGTGLGGGIRQGEACGAVTGAVLVIGLKYGNSNDQEQDKKALCFEKTSEFLQLFQEKQGSIVCRDLLGYDLGKKDEREMATQKDIFRTICPIMIRTAIELLEELGY